MTAHPISETVASLMPRAKAELAELVAFQSVADPAQFPKSECEAAANWVADALRAEDFQDVALLDTPDGTQSVYGFLPGPAGAPTVLLYAHYDVQPPLDESAWLSPPFELTERDGRWYGRGAADCKGGFIMHLLALRALKANGGVPVTVKVIVEGSEEQGTGGLERYAEAHPDLLTADTIVIGDTGQLPGRSADGHGDAARDDDAPGHARHPRRQPALRTVRRRRARRAGRADPAAGLAARRGRHHDRRRARHGRRLGGTAVPGGRVPHGREGARRCGADRHGYGRRPHLGPAGRHRPRHRLPAGGRRDAVACRRAARAQVSLRVPPGQDAAEATQLLTAHLKAHAPWGARVAVEQVGQGQPFRADISSPAYTSMAQAMEVAYPGEKMQSSGMGGSIPLCNTLATLYPEAEILLIGLSEPEAQIHAVNESVSPEELERLSVAEALFLRNYAESKGA